MPSSSGGSAVQYIVILSAVLAPIKVLVLLLISAQIRSSLPPLTIHHSRTCTSKPQIQLIQAQNDTGDTIVVVDKLDHHRHH